MDLPREASLAGGFTLLVGSLCSVYMHPYGKSTKQHCTVAKVESPYFSAMIFFFSKIPKKSYGKSGGRGNNRLLTTSIAYVVWSNKNVVSMEHITCSS